MSRAVAPRMRRSRSMEHVRKGRPSGLPMQLPRVRLRALSADVAIVLALTALTAAAHGVNMFDYPAPSLADDEGTYLEQAWSVLREGRLTPYTYTYDHVPGGWLQIAAWLALVGPRTFGSVTETARVFMLVLHVASVALLFVIARRLSVPRSGAAVAGVLFAASPLVLFYGRQAVLENVMVFWLLASLALILVVRAPPGLVLGGIALGIAALSKEPALVLVPAYAFVVASRAPRERVRNVALVVAPALAVAAIYPAYAFTQGALWPNPAVSLTPTDPRAYAGTSLIDSAIWQLGRPGGNPFDPASELHVALGDWIRRDALLVLGGVAAAVRNALRDRAHSWTTPIGAFGLLAFGFLVRGGIVYPFHVPLALPFLALNLGVVSVELLRRMASPRLAATRRAVVAVAVIAAFWAASGAPRLYVERPGEAARAAIAWIRSSVPQDAVVIGSDDLWADLHEPDLGGRSFTGYHSHWRIAYDDAARQSALPSGWRSVRYIVVSVGLLNGLAHTTHDRTVVDALRNAQPVARWVARTSDPGLHPNQVIEVWAVDDAATPERLRAMCDEIISIVCARGWTTTTRAIR
jgi:4-amino-4-deoxy-L-arabinose transferase-like glycosyltransferase